MELIIKFDEKNTDELLKARYVLDSLTVVYMSIQNHSKPKSMIHEAQVRILDLAKVQDIGKLTLREIGERIGYPHPQQVKHHLSQLIKMNLLKEKI